MIEGWIREIERIAFSTIEQRQRVVGVTGAGRGAGVSEVCRHLANVVARSGKTALLADFSGEPTPPASPPWWPGEAGVAGHVRRDGDQFARLTASFDQTSRFLFNNIDRLRSTFQIDLAAFGAIIVDLPEIPAAGQARLNGAPIAAACDTVLLVALAGRTTQSALAESIATLTSAKAPLAGLVLNDRINPTLGSELAREARRLARIAPALSKRLQRVCLANAFLN